MILFTVILLTQSVNSICCYFSWMHFFDLNIFCIVTEEKQCVVCMYYLHSMGRPPWQCKCFKIGGTECFSGTLLIKYTFYIFFPSPWVTGFFLERTINIICENWKAVKQSEYFWTGEMDKKVTETVLDWKDSCWRKGPKVQT